MNTIISTSIALAVASTVSFANGGDWLELDQDIASLSSSINAEGGASVVGLLRSSYTDTGTTGGWAFEDIVLNFQGSVEDMSWRVSVDLANVDAGATPSVGITLEDAYVSWNCGSDMDIMWGQFNAPMFRSGNIDPESMLFIDRSNLGNLFDAFDEGIGISGSSSGIAWNLVAQNGTDGVGDELFLFAHASYNLGNGACTCCNGALHGGDDMDGTLGISYGDMQNDGTDAVLGLEFYMTMGQFSLQVELADGGDDAIGAGMGEGPLGITFGYLFADNLEAAFRHEDYDDGALDSSSASFGLNYYLHGHNAKWQINYVDDDLAADEAIMVGLTVGASR
jgi:hypothetical protein